MNSISNLIKGFDHVAPGSKTEIRDNSNVGMDGGIENHSFDLSTRDAINLMNQRKAEGKPVTGDDMKAVIKNLADSGQITREEWMDLREYVTKNYDSLSPEAKATFDKLDTALQTAGNQVGWKDGLMDGGTRFDAVVKGPELKTLLDSIDGKTTSKPADTVDQGAQNTHGTGGGGGNGGVKEPSTAPASGAQGGVSSASGWGAIIAHLMSLIDAKEKELKEKAIGLSNQIDGITNDTNKANADAGKTAAPGATNGGGGGTQAAGGGGQTAATKSLNTELADVQDNMQKLKELTEMLTNLLKQTHETTSSVISNLR
jgi:hypothetical protein